MSLSDDVRQVAKGWRWTRRPMVPASVERELQPPDDFPTAWARTPAARAVREVLQRYALGPVLHLEVDVEIFGDDTLKTLTPPAVFILNHSSHLDAATIVTSLPTEWRRKAAVGAASDYFFDVWYRSISTTMFFNAFPIARGGGLRSARLARNLLGDGWSLVLFPEGTRTSDGWVGQFRTGAAWLAMEAGVPVVPVALSGTYQAMPRGRSWPAPGRPPVRVRFGKPVWVMDGERPQAFSDRLRFELGKVQEEERSGWWQSLQAEAQGQLVDPSGPQVAPWRRQWESSRPVRKKWARSIWEPEKDEWMHEPLWTGTSWVPGVGQLPPGLVDPEAETAHRRVLEIEGEHIRAARLADPDDGLDALGWGQVVSSGEPGDVSETREITAATGVTGAGNTEATLLEPPEPPDLPETPEP